MFNLSSILTTAAQAMAKHFVASDSMYQQYKDGPEGKAKKYYLMPRP